MNLKDKRVIVCGMARSGIAAARLLARCGAIVTISDMKPADAFGDTLDELRSLGCVFALGEGPQAHLKNQDMMIISPGIPVAKDFVQAIICFRKGTSFSSFFSTVPSGGSQVAAIASTSNIP